MTFFDEGPVESLRCVLGWSFLDELRDIGGVVVESFLIGDLEKRQIEYVKKYLKKIKD